MRSTTTTTNSNAVATATATTIIVTTPGSFTAALTDHAFVTVVVGVVATTKFIALLVLLLLL